MKSIRLAWLSIREPRMVLVRELRTRPLAKVLVLLVLSVALVACDAYTETGARTSSSQDMSGGNVTVEISSANGTTSRTIEVEGGGGVEMDVDVVLAVVKGTFKIELLGADDEVTLTLEARDGQTVTGRGVLVADAFGEATYRVTATEAENVGYVLDYTFR